MTFAQKFLKVLCWLLIIFSVLSFATGVLFVVGRDFVASESILVEGESLNMGVVSLLMGVAVIFSSVINFVIALLGLRGAKKPEKIGPFFVLAVIDLVLIAGGIVSMFFTGHPVQWDQVGSQIGSFVLVGCAVWAAAKVRAMR